MALTTCPDCSAEISDAAPTCPKCGRPMATPQGAAASTAVYTRPRTSNVTMGCALVFVAIALWAIVKIIGHYVAP